MPGKVVDVVEGYALLLLPKFVFLPSFAFSFAFVSGTMGEKIEVSVEQHPVPDGQSPATVTPTNTNFFHWIQDEESRASSIKHARTVPWIGLVAILVSAATAGLSFTLLYYVDDKATWSTDGWGRVTQPASWLSALVSANSIALHVALTEGVTVAWWFHATRPSATIRDLHKIWATGTSATSAAKEVTALNYVSLATLFVAIIPLNGFLLQGALFVKSREHTKHEEIAIPMVSELPLGYSAVIVNDTARTLSPFIGTIWPVVFQQATNIAGSRYSRYAYFGNWNYGNYVAGDNETTLNEQLYNNLTDATWTANVPGAGFEVQCLRSTVSYNYSSATGNFTRPLFSSSFSWNRTEPNTIQFDSAWKPDYSCSGNLEVRNCTLTAATIEYPVQLRLNVSTAVPGPYYSLQSQTSYKTDKVLSQLPIHADEGLINSTYGGINTAFSRWFGGSIDLLNFTTTSGGYVHQSAGGFASGLLVDYGEKGSSDSRQSCQLGIQYGLYNLGYYESFNSPDPQPESENGWHYWDNTPADPADVILEQIRQAMFLASVYQGSVWYTDSYAPPQWVSYDASSGSRTGDWWVPDDADYSGTHYIQIVDATQARMRPTYGVRYHLWGASLALTYLIILVVLPTFWGFWVLRRKPSMSPVDMARAFSAPVVTAERQRQLQVGELLKEVGRLPIHGLPMAPLVGEQGSGKA